MCLLSWKLGALISWKPQGRSCPVTGIALPPHTSHSIYPRPASDTGSSEFKSWSIFQLSRLNLPRHYLELDLNHALLRFLKYCWCMPESSEVWKHVDLRSPADVLEELFANQSSLISHKSAFQKLITSFHILFTALFTNHPVTQCYTIWIVRNVDKGMVSV